MKRPLSFGEGVYLLGVLALGLGVLAGLAFARGDWREGVVHVVFAGGALYVLARLRRE